MKKIFTDDLAKYESGKYKGKIDWKANIGKRIKFIYDDIEDEVVLKDSFYNGKNTMVYFTYNNKEYNMNSAHFVKGKLGKLFFKSLFETNPELEEEWNWGKNNELGIYPNEVSKGLHTKVWWKCKKNHEWEVSVYSRASGNNCPYCSNQKILIGYNDIPTTDSWMTQFFQGGEEEAKLYMHSSNKSIYPICPDCGKVKDKKVPIYNIYKLHSIGCSCRDSKSYGEKFVFNLLEQLQNMSQINTFEQEVNFEWCAFYNPFKDKQRLGRYDYVIEGKKIIIEVDGGWHRKDNKLNKQKLEESQYIDDEKDRLANENGYKVVRISDEGDIKDNIIGSELNNIFDLSMVNWGKCFEFSATNLVKNVCEYWNQGMTIHEIVEITKFNLRTVREYLKKGVKFGFCDYSREEVLKRTIEFKHKLRR